MWLVCRRLGAPMKFSDLSSASSPSLSSSLQQLVSPPSPFRVIFCTPSPPTHHHHLPQPQAPIHLRNPSPPPSSTTSLSPGLQQAGRPRPIRQPLARISILRLLPTRPRSYILLVFTHPHAPTYTDTRSPITRFPSPAPPTPPERVFFQVYTARQAIIYNWVV